MDETHSMPQTVDEYISEFPAEIQVKLQAIRKVIHDAAPEATEKISWRMPTFVLHGNLVHFAGHKKHIGFYPGAEGIETFQAEFSAYKSSKGGVQFPYDQPLPRELITRIVIFRVGQNKAWAESKAKK